MVKDDRKLSSSQLNSIVVKRDDLGNRYPMVGGGIEGCIYNYKDTYALKHLALFRALEYFYNVELTNKFKKIEKMAQLSDDSFCFPIGLLGFEDLFMEGYYMDLIKFDKSKKDFSYLRNLDDIGMVDDYLLDADAAIKRAHSLGLILGDIKEENILIGDDGKAHFVDTDNYAYNEFSFDLFPYRANTLKNIYGREFSLLDNDKFVYSLMALKLITGNPQLSPLIRDDSIIREAILKTDFSNDIKSGLRLILSDSVDKPYFGQVYTKRR